MVYSLYRPIPSLTDQEIGSFSKIHILMYSSMHTMPQFFMFLWAISSLVHLVSVEQLMLCHRFETKQSEHVIQTLITWHKSKYSSRNIFTICSDFSSIYQTQTNYNMVHHVCISLGRSLTRHVTGLLISLCNHFPSLLCRITWHYLYLAYFNT